MIQRLNLTKDAIMSDYQPSPIVRYFNYQHLPQHLQTISKPIGDLAEQMDKTLPPSAEKSAGLRKLLEAKDCFVRASLGLTTANSNNHKKATV